MKRTARVARTAPDLDHANRLRLPVFGIVKLYLKAGGKTSKSYLPDWAPGATSNGSGSDDFHFAPEKENIEIVYEIDDRFAAIGKAELALYRRFKEAPLWKLDLSKLGSDSWLHGAHSLKWDGRVVTPDSTQDATEASGSLAQDLTKYDPDKTIYADFPDGYVTLEHTPYKLRLTVQDDEESVTATAWTYFHILVKSIELELGPEEIIPKIGDNQLARDKGIRKAIADAGGLPAAGAKRQIYLSSNLYKKTSAEMDTDQAFIEYKTLWGDGPLIPVVAKVRLADSADNEVKLEEGKGAVALGKVKFLWDWEDPDESLSGQSAKPLDFLTAAINYYKNGTDSTRAAKNHTYPKGDNCHVDRGGKRGPDAKPVFPKQTGYDAKDTLDAGAFPFPVNPCEKRKWAATSMGWTSGKLVGSTGVVFQPSRMAGDDYKLTVYLAWDRKLEGADSKLLLDAIDEPIKAPAPIQKSTGVFQVWRRIHISRYIRKRAAVPDFYPANHGAIHAAYGKAYVEVTNAVTANEKYVIADHRKGDGTDPDYNAQCRAALTATGRVVFTANLASDAAANHLSSDSCFLLRPYGEFVQRVHVGLDAAGAGDFAAWATSSGHTATALAEGLGTMNTAGWPASDVKTRLEATQNWLVARNVQTDVKYSNYLNDISPYGDLLNRLEVLKGHKTGATAQARNGIAIVHFDFLHSVCKTLVAAGKGGVTMLLGVALGLNDATRNRVAFVFFKDDVDTFVHEAGHHLFLPHSRYHTGNGIVPAGSQDGRHDDDDAKCTMSYSNDANAFCGLCQLRLRGWTALKLDKDDAKNKKP